MSPPNQHDLQVATHTLRAEAGLWDEQSAALSSITELATQLRLGTLETGMFQLIASAYDAVVDQVTQRCTEGQTRTTEIANTLRQVAATYDAEEQQREHELRKLY